MTKKEIARTVLEELFIRRQRGIGTTTLMAVGTLNIPKEGRAGLIVPSENSIPFFKKLVTPTVSLFTLEQVAYGALRGYNMPIAIDHFAMEIILHDLEII